MKQSDVNRLITDEVDQIEDSDVKQFIRDILAFERSKIDQNQPHFKNEYEDLIKKYTAEDDD